MQRSVIQGTAVLSQRAGSGIGPEEAEGEEEFADRMVEVPRDSMWFGRKEWVGACRTGVCMIINIQGGFWLPVT